MADKEYETEDPFTLNGTVVALSAEEAKVAEEEMTACYISEFARLGYDADAVLELFENPFYRGTFEVFKARGDGFVRRMIEEVMGVAPGKKSNAAAPTKSRAEDSGCGGGCTCGKEDGFDV